jgi:hypothetical protein
MIQHVSVRDESISLVTIYGDSENTRGDHHTVLTVFFKWELLIFRNLLANHLVVRLDVLYFVRDLYLERRADKPLSLLFRVKDWEVRKTLWKNVDKLHEWGVGLSLFLHNQCGEE